MKTRPVRYNARRRALACGWLFERDGWLRRPWEPEDKKRPRTLPVVIADGYVRARTASDALNFDSSAMHTKRGPDG